MEAGSLTVQFLHSIVLLGVFALGIFLGTFLGFKIMDLNLKTEVRRRIEKERYDEIPVTDLSNTRREERVTVAAVKARVRVVQHAMFGTVVHQNPEEEFFEVMIVNISRHGAAILSPSFIPVGVGIQIACADREVGFAERSAMVRSVAATPRELRIGIEFRESLKIA